MCFLYLVSKITFTTIHRELALEKLKGLVLKKLFLRGGLYFEKVGEKFLYYLNNDFNNFTLLLMLIELRLLN